MHEEIVMLPRDARNQAHRTLQLLHPSGPHELAYHRARTLGELKAATHRRRLRSRSRQRLHARPEAVETPKTPCHACQSPEPYQGGSNSTRG